MKNLLTTVLTALAVLFAVSACKETSTPGEESTLKVISLKCENLTDPLAIDSASPHFSYKLISSIDGDCQTAHEIQVASSRRKLESGKADFWKSGKVLSDSQVMIPYEGRKLKAGQLCWWRVRSWDSRGIASEWSEPAMFGIGFIDGMNGRYLRAGDGVPSPAFRKKVSVPKGKDIFVTVNSLGYHELYVNGEKVSDQVMAPAVSQFSKRSLSVTYDITPYLKSGEADIVIWAGSGWYKRNVFNTLPCEGPLVLADISAAGKDGLRKVFASTDSSWEYTPGGYTDTGTWSPGEFGGERVDGRTCLSSMDAASLDAREWKRSEEITVEGMMCTPQMCEPNVIIDRFAAVSTVRQEDGSWLVDIGKDITGWAEVKMKGLTEGQEVVLEYSDHFFEGLPFECQREQRDTYIARGGDAEVFCNKFNYKAYRYIKISNLEAEPQCTALQISGGYSPASSFECSDEGLNAVHDMIRNTFRCLAFSGYMVDCPHIERLGYGGDGNSSTMSIQTMYDVSPLYYNWLQAWGDVIHEDGSLPHTAPEYFAGGGPYWCAFIVKAPWRTLLNFGDGRMVERRYEDMKKWLTYVDRYTTDGLLGKWPQTSYRQWFLGDWIPPRGTGIDPTDETSISLLAQCVVSDVMANMSRIASWLGKGDEAQEFAARRDKVNSLIHEKFFNPKDNTYGSGVPVDIAYASLVGAVPDSLRGKVNRKLEELSYGKYKGHIAVGLVGVPVFTEWCVREHKADLMATILRQRDYPGYLYMIENGATATWEEWHEDRRPGARASHIHNCYNGIGTWFYQALGGIVPDENSPGYRHFFLDPQFPEGISWTKVTKETPYGTVSVKWEKEDGTVRIEADLPVGVTATFKSPVEGGDISLKPGKNLISVR